MFRDRRHAGELLASRLSSNRVRPEAVIVSLPRGGVQGGAVLVRELRLPLDVLRVRKIGAPEQPELAVGAAARGRWWR